MEPSGQLSISIEITSRRPVLIRVELAATLMLLSLCLLLLPGGLFVNDGFSYYGGHPETAGIFIPALLLYAMAIHRGGHAVKRKLGTQVNKTFVAMVTALIGVLLTPYNAGLVIGLLHNFFAMLLFLTQLSVSWRLMSHCHRISDRFLFSAQLLGAVIAFMSLPDIWRFEIAGQAIFQLAFMTILLLHINPPKTRKVEVYF